eukprot:CAMPEP_0118878846 /NCGR_PEP_ID=MMETSP1163-20130328/18719_1 /TAXON_ID=124430 /ORGANISM="Phaeomonas parva, Strain CCMP2877" /LENGTH=44 /DNA_ID= /DNA_START= /DNA_END= /DNA_ORIENTATION=
MPLTLNEQLCAVPSAVEVNPDDDGVVRESITAEQVSIINDGDDN